MTKDNSYLSGKINSIHTSGWLLARDLGNKLTKFYCGSGLYCRHSLLIKQRSESLPLPNELLVVLTN